MTQCSTTAQSLGEPRPPDGCESAATERDADYDLHFVEFDDEGRPFKEASAQIDSAMDQIHALLRDQNRCVRLFVYVHGWRHTDMFGDGDVRNFRQLLRTFAKTTAERSANGRDPCGEPAPASKPRVGLVAPSHPGQPARIVGIAVGWRGLPVAPVEPLASLSFWDRKNTAERVAQGSARELFGRLSQLAAAAPAAGRPVAQAPPAAGPQLRTYVIGHSFGADIAFTALSQSLIDSFAEGLDDDHFDEWASVPRFVDTLILINPAMEAARFDALYRVAEKRKAYCALSATSDARCRQPKYQGPVLAILQSEGDVATRAFFPLGTAFSTTFETAVDADEARSVRQTIGWDDRYATHQLTLATCKPSDNPSAFEVDAGTARYRPAGWSRCFDGFLQTHLDGEWPAGAPPADRYNGPIWNMRVAADIVKNHTDIWNASFHRLLADLIDEETSYPFSLILRNDSPLRLLGAPPADPPP